MTRINQLQEIIAKGASGSLNKTDQDELLISYRAWKINILNDLNNLGNKDNGEINYEYLLTKFQEGFRLDNYPYCMPGDEFDHLREFELSIEKIANTSRNVTRSSLLDFELYQIKPLKNTKRALGINPISNFNLFTNQHDEKILVSIPLNNQISSLMTPLLFYELRMNEIRKNVLKLRSWWKCSYIPGFISFKKPEDHLYILKDKFDITLKEYLKEMLYRREPDVNHVYTIVENIFYQFFILHKKSNGFLHGNLLVENIALKSQNPKPEIISMINLDNSSFFVNGYRFYKPTENRINDAAIDKINEHYAGIQYDDGLDEFFYMLIQPPPSIVPGFVTDFVQNTFASVTLGAYDMFTGLFPKLNLTKFDILNILLVQNNPIASLPGSYDTYTFMCSLYSNDFMYIHVMKPYFSSKTGLRRKESCKLKKYNIDKKFCQYRNNLAELWVSIWFPDEVVDATKKILDLGRERKALNDIVSINAFIQTFRLKVNMENVFKKLGYRRVKERIIRREIFTTEKGNMCLEYPKIRNGKNECDTLFRDDNTVIMENVEAEGLGSWKNVPTIKENYRI